MKSYTCKECFYTTENPNAIGGHGSGHSRRTARQPKADQTNLTSPVASPKEPYLEVSSLVNKILGEVLHLRKENEFWHKQFSDLKVAYEKIAKAS